MLTRLVTDEERGMEPEDPEIVAACVECGCQIERGQIYGMDDMGNAICRDCLDEEWSKIPDDEAFGKLGYEVVV